MQILEPLADRLKVEESYLCLDLVNTVDWRRGELYGETLHSYTDLVAWAGRVALVSAEEAAALLAQAETDPADAQAVFDRAIVLREAIYRVIHAVVEDSAPSSQDIAQVNREVGAAMAWGELCPTGAGFSLQWKTDVSRLDGMLAPIARSAADLLTSGALDRLGICPGDGDCGWVFYDTSRNHSRTWCSMESCGNRAKAKRHYKKSVNQG
jgi:predicted RNA-binding Zn ribbon-like protein